MNLTPAGKLSNFKNFQQLSPADNADAFIIVYFITSQTFNFMNFLLYNFKNFTNFLLTPPSFFTTKILIRTSTAKSTFA